MNHWTKFNQFGARVTHMNGACISIIFGLAPWGCGEESKGQISFNSNYKANFKDYYTKLCVCSHKLKIQNISDRIFILSPWLCPRVGTWGCIGVKNQIMPRRLSDMLSPHKPFDEIQPISTNSTNLVCELHT